MTELTSLRGAGALVESVRRLTSAGATDVSLWDGALIVLVLLGWAAITFAFGGVEQWAQALASIGIGLACALLGLKLLLHPASGVIHWSAGAAIVAPLYLLVVGLALVQLLPAGSWLPAHPAWSLVAPLAPEPISPRVSLAPELTGRALIWWLLYGAAGGLLWWLARDRQAARFALRLFLLVQVGFAGIALFNAWGSGPLERLSGTFVNPNNYATFVALGLVAATAWLITSGQSADDAQQPASQRAANVAATLLRRRTGTLAAWLALATALLLTQSRAGMAAAAAGLLVLMLLLFVRARKRPGLGLLGLLLVVAAVVGTWLALSPESVLERFTGDPVSGSVVDRAALYAVSWQAAREAPVLGTGLGTFQYAIFPYLDSGVVSTTTLYDAHNTYLELIIELGWAGFVLVMALFVGLFVALVRGVFARQRDGHHPAAAAAGLVVVAVHALFDFSVELPAVALALTILLALGVAQSQSRTQSQSRSQRR